MLRNILRIVDALPVLYLVGLGFVAVTGKNQRIGDLAAGTVVVRVPWQPYSPRSGILSP